MEKICTTGNISEVSSEINIELFSRYLSGNNALVAQGGGQKGIFTAGVLDALLLSNFDPFSHFYGTSAGALNILAYLCRQPRLAHQFITKLTTDSRFFSLYGFMRTQKKMNIGWAIEQLNHYPFKLDLNLGQRVLGGRQAYASVTSAHTLKDNYLPMFSPDWQATMEASCAIPHLHPGSVNIAGKDYIDGGVSASIPVQEAWRRGARCIVVIRTEPIDAELEQQPLINEQSTTAISDGWYQESVQWLQEYWFEQKRQWQQDWRRFVDERTAAVQAQKQHKKAGLLNGGRWLFGADDVYRLSQLLGGDFSAQMVDKLMVHYQTYQLTQQFLTCPPQDAFIVQIAPQGPLQSRPLLSDLDSIEADYQTGLDAGYRFVEQFQKAIAMSETNLTQSYYSQSLSSWDTD